MVLHKEDNDTQIEIYGGVKKKIDEDRTVDMV